MRILNRQRGVLEDSTGHTTLTSIGNGGVELAILGCRFSNSQKTEAKLHNLPISLDILVDKLINP
nr:hypothetical protein [Nostoc sp. DedVER01b]